MIIYQKIIYQNQASVFTKKGFQGRSLGTGGGNNIILMKYNISFIGVFKFFHKRNPQQQVRH